MTTLFGDSRAAFVIAGETAHNKHMTLEEFAKLQPGDWVEHAGVEYRVQSNDGGALKLSAGQQRCSVPREQAEALSLLRRLSPRERRAEAEWNAVRSHLRLVNLARARIGQRPLSRQSGYTPADVKADAEFYVSTSSWARQRATELGIHH